MNSIGETRCCFFCITDIGDGIVESTIFRKTHYMTEIHRLNRRPKFRGILLIMVISMAIGVFFLFKSCNSASSRISGNVLLEKGGQKFLYSGLTSAAVIASIERAESPQIFKKLLVYQDGDEFFVAPSSIDKICAIQDILSYFIKKAQTV